MYKRILVAADGSEQSSRAVEHALALARGLGSSVVAVSVVETVPFAGGHSLMAETMAPHYVALTAALRQRAEAVVDSASAAAAKAGVEMEIEVLEGRAASCIVEAAGKHEVDLIVMGTHGRSQVGSLLMGSCAQAVVHGSPAAPVLLVR